MDEWRGREVQYVRQMEVNSEKGKNEKYGGLRKAKEKERLRVKVWFWNCLHHHAYISLREL